jgi:predicted P-loop ATPase
MAVPRAGGGDWKSKLIRNAEGGPRLLLENFDRVFRDHPLMRGRLAYDVRSGKVIATSPLPWHTEGLTYPRELIDPDDIGATIWLGTLGLHGNSTALIHDTLNAVARANPRDDVVAWLEGLPTWDGVPRASTWMQTFLGVEDSVYTRAVSRAFLVSMVARAKRPGCKVDTCLTLVGPQGALKSTALRVLASGPGEQYFSDTLGDVTDPRVYIPNMQGPWLVEIAEFAAFSRKETELTKHFLSIQVDRARPPYGRRTVDSPRRCVISASTNKEQYLIDDTGNRRFWSVTTGNIDIEGLRNIREQLFAEAAALFSAGEPWYLDKGLEAVAAEHQELHTAEVTGTVTIRDYITARNSTEIALDHVEALLPRRGLRGTPSQHLGIVMGILGWTCNRPRVNGHRIRVYRRPEGWTDPLAGVPTAGPTPLGPEIYNDY